MDDVHVHHSDAAAVPAPHDDPVNHPEVLADADSILCEFKALIEKEYPNASFLYEGAKNLWEPVKYHWTQGKHRVLKGEWSADDFDRDLMDLFCLQEGIWNKLMNTADKLHLEIDELYKKVEKTHDDVKHARGEPPRVAGMSFPTPDQATIRKVYDHKLRFAFRDAYMDYESLCGYPDGILTKMKLLRERTIKETNDLVEWCRKKEHVHKASAASEVH
jgi:hypothetical protein